jgi:hypothetical protein
MKNVTFLGLTPQACAVILEFVDVPVREEPAPEAKTGAGEKKSGEKKSGEAAKPAEGKKEKEAAATPA